MAEADITYSNAPQHFRDAVKIANQDSYITCYNVAIKVIGKNASKTDILILGRFVRKHRNN